MIEHQRAHSDRQAAESRRRCSSRPDASDSSVPVVSDELTGMVQARVSVIFGAVVFVVVGGASSSPTLSA
jgi:hypothetical protein